MAPRQPYKNKAATFMEGSEAEETPGSQRAEHGENMFVRAEKLVLNNQKRRDSQRKLITTEHEQHVKTTKAKINTLFLNKKTRITKSQRALWERLNDMNKRRQDLEGRILASMKNIETQTGNISSEIDAVLAARIKEIEDSSAEEGN